MTPKSQKEQGAIQPVDKADDATIYFSGIIAPTLKADTLYSVDARAGWTVRRLGKNGGVPLAVSGAAKTDKRPQADLDSFNLFASLEDYGHDIIVKSNLAGLEFDRQAKVMNVVSYTRFVVPLNTTIVTRTKDASGNIQPHLRATFELDLVPGVEIGENLRNAYSAANGSASGSGFILRGVPGLSGLIVVPAPVVKKLAFQAEYTVRLPAVREVFLDTRGLAPKADPVATLDRRARPHAKASMTLMASPWIGLKFGYEYGSVPPTFQFANHGASLTLVFQAKQNH
jgi:hypothetical protein